MAGVSRHEYLWGEVCRKYTVNYTCYWLQVSDKISWVFPLSSSLKRSHSHSVAAASSPCFSSLFLAGFIHFSLAALGETGCHPLFFSWRGEIFLDR